MYHMIAQLVLAVVILTWHFSLGGRYLLGCQRDAIHAYMYNYLTLLIASVYQ